MSTNLFDQIYTLSRAGESFAVATVVRVEKPISAKPGDKAIINSDGTLNGWVGGGCSQDIVIREAKKAIREGQPRFLRLVGSGAAVGTGLSGSSDHAPALDGQPQGGQPQGLPLHPDGIIEFPITCHSGGTMDVFIEPMLPRPQLIVLGNSPVAITLAKLAKTLNFEIVVCEPTATREQFPDADSLFSQFDLKSFVLRPLSFVVIATQGHDDELALEAAALSGVPYIAFVASKKKFASRVEYLRERGLSDEQIARIKAPAGLDIGAVTPDEIAVSILAEMIQVRRKSDFSILRQALDAEVVSEARDVICGMMVEIATAKYVAEYRGAKYYFCSASCKLQFEKNPANDLNP